MHKFHIVCTRNLYCKSTALESQWPRSVVLSGENGSSSWFRSLSRSSWCCLLVLDSWLLVCLLKLPCFVSCHQNATLLADKSNLQVMLSTMSEQCQKLEKQAAGLQSHGTALQTQINSLQSHKAQLQVRWWFGITAWFWISMWWLGTSDSKCLAYFFVVCLFLNLWFWQHMWNSYYAYNFVSKIYQKFTFPIVNKKCKKKFWDWRFSQILFFTERMGHWWFFFAGSILRSVLL